MMHRYVVETRWRENDYVLAWGYVAEFKTKEMAIQTCRELLRRPRKVHNFECRVMERIYVDDRPIRYTPVETNQLEFKFLSSPDGVPSGKLPFVSGINYFNQ